MYLSFYFIFIIVENWQNFSYVTRSLVLVCTSRTWIGIYDSIYTANISCVSVLFYTLNLLYYSVYVSWNKGRNKKCQQITTKILFIVMFYIFSKAQCRDIHFFLCLFATNCSNLNCILELWSYNETIINNLHC